MSKIGIIDYGVGNLRNIQKAFEYNEMVAIVSSKLDELRECDKVVLPGVGSFLECKKMLNEHFGKDIYELLNTKPTLGICVGMQLLFDYSLEFQKTNGLKLIDGFVDKLETVVLPVPNTGWNKIKIKQKNVLFDNIPDGSFVYFTHSYKCNVVNESNCIALVEYENDFCCAVWQDNIYGVQFHPEKSGEIGLKILKNFATSC